MTSFFSMSSVVTTIQHKILSLYYNLTRTDNSSVLQRQCRELLFFLKWKKHEIGKACYLDFVQLLWMMVAETRDIENGKGERELTYMLLLVWYEFSPLLSIWMWKILLGVEGPSGIGCWKDVKYLCQYVREKTGRENHPLILASIDIVLQELHDVVHENKLFRFTPEFNQKTSPAATFFSKFSNVAKWIPREKTKYHWLFRQLVEQWSCHRGSSFEYKRKKFRTLISQLNRDLHVVEILQCSRQKISATPPSFRQTSLINPAHITTLGFLLKPSLKPELQEYMYSDRFFHNVSRTRPVWNKHAGRFVQPFRTDCSRVRNIPIGYYAKKAWNVAVEKELGWLNTAWSHALSLYPSLGCFIPVVFVDKFVLDASFYFSVALACLMSEKSIVAKRILLVIQGSPQWVSLSDCPDFVSSVAKIKHVMENLSWIPEYGSPVEDVVRLLMDSMIHTRMSTETMEKMVLVFVNADTTHTEVVDAFRQHSVSISDMPHILYWNSSPKTRVLPCQPSDVRVSLASGMAGSLIHSFFLIQLKLIRNLNAYDILRFQIHRKKYLFMETMFDRICGTGHESL